MLHITACLRPSFAHKQMLIKPQKRGLYDLKPSRLPYPPLTSRNLPLLFNCFSPYAKVYIRSKINYKE